jgi:hypothetical protein
MRSMEMNGAAAPGPFRFIFSRNVARRSLTIAAVVGCLLSITNQGDVLLQQGLTPTVGLKIGMNFFIPFAVASVSALLNRDKK